VISVNSREFCRKPPKHQKAEETASLRGYVTRGKILKEHASKKKKRRKARGGGGGIQGKAEIIGFRCESDSRENKKKMERK